MPDGRRFLACSLSLGFLFFGCVETDLGPLPPTPPLSFEKLKQRVSQIRGLPLRHDVALETGTIDEIQALFERSIMEDAKNEHLPQTARIYKRLGLLPEDTDLPKALRDLYLFQQEPLYDPRRNVMIVPRAPSKPSLAFAGSPWGLEEDTARQLLLTYALTRALQEQHFHLEQNLKYQKTADSRLALRALAKGDAVLVGLAHLMGDSKEKILDGIKALTRLAERADKELFHLPELLRQKATFQYLQGSQFVLWAYSVKGWEGVNRLFSDPPLSTKQLLHPEKYYAKRVDPVQITPWSLIRQFGAQKIIEETLGQFLIRVLLSRTLSKEEAAQAAAGWAGDNLFAFQQGEELVLGWVTAWDNQEEALEFYRSYRGALEKRYRISLQPTPISNDTLTTAPESGHPLLLQARGAFVLLLDGIPSPRSAEIAEALWKELETGTEPLRIPLDLVRQHRQPLSLVR
jgi:hypothetical protein